MLAAAVRGLTSTYGERSYWEECWYKWSTFRWSKLLLNYNKKAHLLNLLKKSSLNVC